MKIKYFLLLCGLMLLASDLVVAETTYYEENNSVVFDTDSNYLAVTKLRYEPYPVSPGEYFTIWIEVDRSGSSKLDATFTLLEDYPFSLDDDEDATVEFSNLGSDSVVLEYEVRVDEDAVSGYNTLRLQQSLEGYATVVTEFDVYVYDVKTSFDAVVQDNDDGELSIALANIGQNDANAVIVRVPDQDGVTVTGTNGQMLGNLEQGDYTVVGFETSATVSSVVLQIDYTDTIGERRSEYLEVPLSSSYDSVSLNASDFGERMDMGAGPGGSNSMVKWIIGIAVLVVVVFFGRKFYLKRSTGNKNGKKGKKSGTPSWVNKNKGAD